MRMLIFNKFRFVNYTNKKNPPYCYDGFFTKIKIQKTTSSKNTFLL